MTIPQAWIDDLGTDDDRMAFLEEIDPDWKDHFLDWEDAIDFYTGLNGITPKEFHAAKKRMS